MKTTANPKSSSTSKRPETEQYPEEELAFLADFVEDRDYTLECIKRYGVEDEAFTNGNCRSAFQCLKEIPDCDVSKARMCRTVVDILHLQGDDFDKFIERGLHMRQYIAERAHKLATMLYQRRIRAACILATSNIDDCYDAESFMSKVNCAIKAVPRPPSLNDKSDEQVAAERIAAESEGELPEELLHVPGFIDDVVEYSMGSAYTANRVLSFAGALALTAHLMGRRYTDMRDTRSNLFVFALAPTGSGKEHPRRVNRGILKSCKLMQTVFDDIASGEAIEETLYRHPRTLLQIDEVQKLMQQLKDERNITALSIAKYLMALYTASGESHSMRPKATQPDEIGRVIDDPSLTLFATGVSPAAFRALTPSIIKEGLLGRCLMLDTSLDGTDNTFPEGRPPLPPNLVAAANEITSVCGRRDSTAEEPKPEEVPFAQGVNEYVNEVIAETKRRKRACRKEGDEIGEALWARAPEKVSKLAMIAAVSERRDKPIICRKHAEWAWKFTECLLERMARRVAAFMASDKIEEGCQKFIDVLVKFKGKCTRRDMLRQCRAFHADQDYDKIVNTLEARGAIFVSASGKNSIHYRLVKE